ncbi:ATP-dependent acyl-CoA ligase [Pseudonocardia xishanensis]|uniref:ATP-dependent acyl-CoA ligase n=2 Tax=Pseudonocardia xishanensis TaxID=630995 RepID=A0ABP8RR48_9PSEU
MSAQSWQGIRHYTIPQRLEELAREKGSSTFARFGDWAPTYSEIDRRAAELGGQLHALGAEPGDRVATLASNRYELVELIVGVGKLGGVLVPLNPYLKGTFLKHQLSDSEPTVLITDSLGWKSVRPLLPDLPSITAIVLLDPLEDGSHPQVVDYATLPHGPLPERDITPATTMAIVYTSGTTGEPKGCVLSHGYHARVGETVAELFDLVESDVIITPLPLFHASTQLSALMPALTRGIPVVFLPEFSASRFLKTATEVGATILSGVGALASLLLASPPGPHDRAHSLRIINLSPLDPALHPQFRERFGVDPWSESYGQTECVFQTFLDSSSPRDRGGNGKSLRDLELAVLDDDGQPVADGEVGEICIRPRHRFAMFDGYWRRPEATLEAFRGLWFHTGDFGTVRESGDIRFVDRKKDALRVRGENVSSLELESALLQYPDIAQAAVHAMASAVGEDDIKACLVLHDGHHLDIEKFFVWMTDNVPYFAVPRYMEIVDELPKNHVGRIHKHLLRERGRTSDTIDFHARGLKIERAQRR